MRIARDTAPPGLEFVETPPHVACFGERQLELLRDAVRAELAASGQIRPAEADMRDKALWILAIALLAAVVVLGTALAMSMLMPWPR